MTRVREKPPSFPFPHSPSHLLQIQSEIPSLPGIERGAVRLNAQSGPLLGRVDVELPPLVAPVQTVLVLVDLQVKVVEDACQVGHGIICKREGFKRLAKVRDSQKNDTLPAPRYSLKIMSLRGPFSWW